MALITCPECNKEVSNRALACPFCGFPLEEYFQQKEEEKQRIAEMEQQKIDEEKRERRKVSYSLRKEFSVCNQTISFDENEKICAIIGAEFLLKQESVHRRIQEMLLKDDLATINDSQFANRAIDLIDIIYKPMFDVSEYWCEKFLGDLLQEDKEDVEDEEKDIVEDFIDCFNEAIDFKALWKTLFSTYSDAKKEYDLNALNAHMQYHDDYYAAGTPPTIKEVYSSTLLGLVGKSVSAKLVNGAISALSSEQIKRKEKRAENQYQETIYKEIIKCNVKIYSVLDDAVDIYVNACKKFVLDYLMDKGYLFKKCGYPKGDFNFENYCNLLGDAEKTNTQKKEAFYKFLCINPGDLFSFIAALEGIVFSKTELESVIELIDFLGLRDDMIKVFRDENNPVLKLFEGKFAESYEKYYSLVSEGARTMDGIVFSSVEEKETYILERKKYGKRLDEFFRSQNWFEKRVFKNMLKKIKNLCTPTSDKWKELYNESLRIGALIENEISSDFVKTITSAVKTMQNAEETVEIYSVGDIEKGLVQDKKNFIGLEKCVSQNELPIMKIKGCPNILYITTRAFYLIGKQEKNVIIRFTIEDIEGLNYSEKGFYTNQSMKLSLRERGTLEIFNDNYPKKDIPVLTAFAKELVYIIENIPFQDSQMTEAEKEKDLKKKEEEEKKKPALFVETFKESIAGTSLEKNTIYEKLENITDKELVTKLKYQRDNFPEQYVMYFDQTVYVSDKYFNWGPLFRPIDELIEIKWDETPNSLEKPILIILKDGNRYRLKSENQDRILVDVINCAIGVPGAKDIL